MSLDISLYYINDNTSDVEYVYHANVTHNLNKMAKASKIYYALWRPNEINVLYAKDIISILERGLIELKSNKHFYETFNAPNGWGTYELFIPFVENYLNACILHPNSQISVDR